VDTQSILNVDDYAPARYHRSTTLRQGGFTVHEAATGGEALQKLSLRPALVLLDVNLPDIDGFEVCRRIRADPQASGTIVIHMSASRLGSRDQVRGLENGADLFLAEPTDGEVLVATVKALLRARVAEAAVRHANESLLSLICCRMNCSSRYGACCCRRSCWADA
jgi:DNA-binding response OmpR family regulator